MSTSVAEKVMDRKEVAYQIRCSRSLMNRMEFAAGKLGLSVAAWLRMLAIQNMNENGIPENPPKTERKKKSKE